MSWINTGDPNAGIPLGQVQAGLAFLKANWGATLPDPLPWYRVDERERRTFTPEYEHLMRIGFELGIPPFLLEDAAEILTRHMDAREACDRLAYNLERMAHPEQRPTWWTSIDPLENMLNDPLNWWVI